MCVCVCVCVSVCLPVCAGVCVCLCHCLGYNFWSSLHRNFIFDFDVNFYKVLAQQTQRHTDTHRHTLIHNKLITYMHSFKKVKFSYFLVLQWFFRLQILCLADSYVGLNISPRIHLAEWYVSPNISTGYVWTFHHFGWCSSEIIHFASLHLGMFMLGKNIPTHK